MPNNNYNNTCLYLFILFGFRSHAIALLVDTKQLLLQVHSPEPSIQVIFFNILALN